MCDVRKQTGKLGVAFTVECRAVPHITTQNKQTSFMRCEFLKVFKLLQGWSLIDAAGV
jgi:hypothetical protein